MMPTAGRQALAAVAAGVALFVIPLAAEAATLSYGPIIPDVCNCPGTAAGYGCVILVVNELVNFAITLGTIIAVLALVYAGFVWVTSAANSEGRGKARNMLINVAIGLVIVLAAYLIVDYFLSTLYNGSYGAWNGILADQAGDTCIQVKAPTAIANPVGAILGAVTTGTNANQTGASGSTGSGTDHLNISAAVGNINANALSSDDGACLHNVRQALAAGGVNLSCPNNGNQLQQYAGQCNGPLQALGFNTLGSNDSSPQAGDIFVETPVGSHTIGHIAMYNGSQWVSDFVQSNGEVPPGCPYDSTTGCPNPTYWRP